VRAVYSLLGTRNECESAARDITVEQTIEFPVDLVKDRFILDHVVARVESLVQVGDTTFEATVAYAADVAGDELTQWLNVLFGNISLKPGIRLERIVLPDSLPAFAKGPRFGIPGLRKLLNAPTRPLVCSALKPLGLPAPRLAELAERLALGGVDMIKDDHGLADQPLSRFKERVQRCAAVVQEVNVRTSGRCLYLPNLTSPAGELLDRAHTAAEAGAGGFLFAPGLAGFDSMRVLSQEASLGRPLFAHPAFLGAFVTSPTSGIAHRAIFGQLMRLAGADATIFPNFGGRFSFSPDDCRNAADGARAPMGPLLPIFPVPAGGMSLARISEIIRFYGNDVILLIGGDLHRHPDGIVAACRGPFRAGTAQ